MNDRRMTWHGTPATSAWTWPRKRGGSASPARCSSVPASGPVTLIAASDIVRSRTWTRRPQTSIQSRSHISALAAPPDVNDSTNRVSALAQDHPVVHDVAALVEQQRVARPAGLDVRDVARVDPLEQLHDVRAGDDQLAERRHVADRDALADRPVFRDRVAVVPRPPPATEPIHPRPERQVLVVERRPAERVHVAVRAGLGEGDLAGRGPGGERIGHLAGPGGDPRADVGQARAALARAETGLAGALEQLELGEAAVPGGAEVGDGRAHAAAHDALGRWRGERHGRRPRRRRRSPARHRPSAPGDRAAPGRGRRPRCRPASSSRRRSPGRPYDGPDAPVRRLRTARGRRVRPPTHAGPGPRRRSCSPSAARAVTIPASRLPGHDRMDLGGARRDHDLARMDVEHAVRSCGPRSSARRRSRRPPRRHAASRTRTDLPARSASAAAASPLDPPPMTATSTSRWCSSTVTGSGVAVRSVAATTGSAGIAPAGCRATRRPGRAAVWHVRT